MKKILLVLLLFIICSQGVLSTVHKACPQNRLGTNEVFESNVFYDVKFFDPNGKLLVKNPSSSKQIPTLKIGSYVVVDNIKYNSYAAFDVFPELSCGDTIKSGGDWFLTKNLSNCANGDSGLFFKNNGFNLNCRGNTISGSAVDGVAVNKMSVGSQVTVKNCVLSGFTNGVHLNDLSNSFIIQNNKFSDFINSGLFVENVSGNVLSFDISNNFVNGNGNGINGFKFENISRKSLNYGKRKVRENVIENYTNGGIFAIGNKSGVNQITFSDNIVRNGVNGANAFILKGSKSGYNEIFNNKFLKSEIGIKLDGGISGDFFADVRENIACYNQTSDLLESSGVGTVLYFDNICNSSQPNGKCVSVCPLEKNINKSSPIEKNIGVRYNKVSNGADFGDYPLIRLLSDEIVKREEVMSNTLLEDKSKWLCDGPETEVTFFDSGNCNMSYNNGVFVCYGLKDKKIVHVFNNSAEDFEFKIDFAKKPAIKFDKLSNSIASSSAFEWSTKSSFVLTVEKDKKSHQSGNVCNYVLDDDWKRNPAKYCPTGNRLDSDCIFYLADNGKGFNKISVFLVNDLDCTGNGSNDSAVTITSYDADGFVLNCDYGGKGIKKSIKGSNGNGLTIGNGFISNNLNVTIKNCNLIKKSVTDFSSAFSYGVVLSPNTASLSLINSKIEAHQGMFLGNSFANYLTMVKGSNIFSNFIGVESFSHLSISNNSEIQTINGKGVFMRPSTNLTVSDSIIYGKITSVKTQGSFNISDSTFSNDFETTKGAVFESDSHSVNSTSIISNLKIPYSNKGFSFSNAHGKVTLKNINISSASSTGVDIVDSNFTFFKLNNSNINATLSGVIINNTKNVVVDNVIIDDVVSTDVKNGIEILPGSENVLIKNSKIEAINKGIFIENSDNVTIEDVNIGTVGTGINQTSVEQGVVAICSDNVLIKKSEIKATKKGLWVDVASKPVKTTGFGTPCDGVVKNLAINGLIVDMLNSEKSEGVVLGTEQEGGSSGILNGFVMKKVKVTNAEKALSFKGIKKLTGSSNSVSSNSFCESIFSIGVSNLNQMPDGAFFNNFLSVFANNSLKNVQNPPFSKDDWLSVNNFDCLGGSFGKLEAVSLNEPQRKTLSWSGVTDFDKRIFVWTLRNLSERDLKIENVSINCSNGITCSFEDSYDDFVVSKNDFLLLELNTAPVVSNESETSFDLSLTVNYHFEDENGSNPGQSASVSKTFENGLTFSPFFVEEENMSFKVFSSVFPLLNCELENPSIGLGLTGAFASIETFYNWDLRENSIGFSGDGYSYVCSEYYCDSTQLMIALVNYLESLRGQTGLKNYKKSFDIFLTKDAITSDFRKDFDYTYRNNYGLIGSSYYVQYWSDYVKDFKKLDIPTGFNSAGLYQLTVETLGDVLPGANVVVSLKKIGSSSGVLNKIAFDGKTHSSASLSRKDYGVGFSGDNILVDNSTFGGKIFTSETGGLKQFSTSHENNYSQLNFGKNYGGISGMVLEIDNSSNKITFFKPKAVPLLAKFKIGNIGKSELFYEVIVGEKKFLSNNGSIFTWTGLGMQSNDVDKCKDFLGDDLGFLTDSDTSEQCSGSFGYIFNQIEKSKKNDVLFAGSVLFSTKGTNDYSITEQCNTSSELILDKGFEREIDSLSKVLDLVKQEYVCVLKKDNLVRFYWNRKKLLDEAVKTEYGNNDNFPEWMCNAN